MMRTHPITGMTLEDGRGALPDDQQAMVLHLPYIELTRGQAAADEMRKQMGIPTQADLEAAAKAQAAEVQAKNDRIAKALALLDQHEADQAALVAASKPAVVENLRGANLPPAPAKPSVIDGKPVQ